MFYLLVWKSRENRDLILLCVTIFLALIKVPGISSKKLFLNDANYSRNQRCKGPVSQRWLLPLPHASSVCPLVFPSLRYFLEKSFLFFACHHATGVAKTTLIPYEALPSFGLSSTSSTTQTTKMSILSWVPLWVCWVIGTWSYWWLPSRLLKCLKSRTLKNFYGNWEVYQGPMFGGISE